MAPVAITTARAAISLPVLDADEVTLIAGFEGDRDVRGRGPGVELARLGDGPAGQLAAADPGRKAEVVLDPPWRSPAWPPRTVRSSTSVSRPSEAAVDGRAESRRAAADDQQVHLLMVRKLEADSERSGDLAVARGPEARRPPVCARAAAGPGRVTRSGTSPRCRRRPAGARVAPAVGDPGAPQPLRDSAGPLRGSRPDHLDARARPRPGGARAERRMRTAGDRRGRGPRRGATRSSIRSTAM